MPAKQVTCTECAEKDKTIQELEKEIESLEDQLEWKERDLEDKRDEWRDVEELIALRDKELAMPGSVLECEWRRAWKKIGANG